MSTAIPDPKKPEANVTTQSANAIDVKALPEFVQMSQTNNALAAELTTLKREKYAATINGLLKAGKCTKAKADSMLATVGTYQFSTTVDSTIAKLDIQIETLNDLPEGAVWTGEERTSQMSISTETNKDRGGFFVENGGKLTEEEADKLLDDANFYVAKR